jgi:hypothetical protein
MDSWGMEVSFHAACENKNIPSLGVSLWAELDSNLRPPLCKREERGFYYLYQQYMVVFFLPAINT